MSEESLLTVLFLFAPLFVSDNAVFLFDFETVFFEVPFLEAPFLTTRLRFVGLSVDSTLSLFAFGDSFFVERFELLTQNSQS